MGRGRPHRDVQDFLSAKAASGLSATIVRALLQHHLRQEVERLVAGDAWEEHGLVFCTQRGRPLIERNLIRTFKGCRREPALPREIPLYDLHHSCATLLLGQGVPLRSIMELLVGHATFD